MNNSNKYTEILNNVSQLEMIVNQNTNNKLLIILVLYRIFKHPNKIKVIRMKEYAQI